MNIFLQHLNSPEYMHVLLNPVPVYGLAIGVVGLLLAVIARNRTGIVIALGLVFLSGLSAWPTYQPTIMTKRPTIASKRWRIRPAISGSMNTWRAAKN